MFERYMQYNSIPSGAVLKRILRKKNVSQKFLAEQDDILPQRVNDYIMNKRRFTVDVSLKLEKVLDIKIPGFFYLIQSNHDVYLKQKENEQHLGPNLSKFRRNLFWDMDISVIDWVACKHSVIQRCFEYGNEVEIKEIISFYGKDVVRDVYNDLSTNWKKAEREQNFNRYLK